MWLINAQSPLLFGGVPLQKRRYLSVSGSQLTTVFSPSLSSTFPHLSKLNGGLATTVSNFIRASPSFSFGLRIVSPQRIVALSKPCKNMFITANAQVLPFASCPKSEKLSEPTSSPALISKEAEPQVGSQIREPGFDLVSFAMSVETSFGVKNSPAFFPASLAKFSIRNMYAPPIISVPSRCDGRRSNESLLKSSNRFFKRVFLSFVSPNTLLLKLMFWKIPAPSSLYSLSRLASTRSSKPISINSPILSSFR